MGQEIIPLKAFPFQGGIDEVREPVLLPNGSLVINQNTRPRRPGFEQRKGQQEHHTTDNDSQDTHTLYQFSKGEVTERHLFRQLADGSIEEATDNPFDNRLDITAFADAGGGTVTVTSAGHGLSNSDVVTIFGTTNYNGTYSISGVAANTFVITVTWVTDDATGTWLQTPTVGNFGSTVLAARSGPSPASWGDIKDVLVMTDGAGKPVVYAGQTVDVDAFVVFKGSTSIPEIPEEGEHYTTEVTDGDATTVAILDDLNTAANFHAVFIGTSIRANKLTWTVSAANGTSSVVTVKYKKDDSTWTAVSGQSDGTASGGATLAITGDMTWTIPTDEIPHFMFGQSMFWYRLEFSAQLDSEVEISAVSYEGPFQEIQNVWDGELVSSPEIRIYDDSQGAYTRHDSQAVDLSFFESTKDAKTLDNAAAVDKGGGLVGIPLTAHGYAVDDRVTLDTTTNYDGVHIIISQTANEFVITATYVAETFTGAETANIKADWIHIATFDPLLGYYLDPENTPNKILATVTGTDISFSQSSSTDDFKNQDVIYRREGDLISQGFEPGDSVTVSGSTSNDATYVIARVERNRLFVQTSILTGEPAGDTVTLSKTGTDAIDRVEVWNGSDFINVSGTLEDGTAGLTKPGYVTFGRTAGIQRSQHDGSDLFLYRYRFSFSSKLSQDIVCAIFTLPYFDFVEFFGTTAQSSAVWKGRAVYSFKDETAHFTAKDRPMVLNGADKGSISVGTGSKNPIIAFVPFFNELLAFQQETATKGGVTVIEGDTPSGQGAFDKLVLTSTIGIMNAKCVVSLEDVSTSDLSTDNPIAPCAFWLSQYGVFKTNGKAFRNVSGGIANYLDPTKTNSIRKGYENKHFLRHDPTYNVLILGLVTGTSATKPNTYLIYDYFSDAWATDVRGQDLSDIINIEADSGDYPILQMGAGQAGTIYRLNVTDDDVTTAITSKTRIVLDGEGKKIISGDVATYCKSQARGKTTLNVYTDGETGTSFTKDISMINASADYVRSIDPVGRPSGDHIELEWVNANAGEIMYLLKFGVSIEEVVNNQ